MALLSEQEELSKQTQALQTKLWRINNRDHYEKMHKLRNERNQLKRSIPRLTKQLAYCFERQSKIEHEIQQAKDEFKLKKQKEKENEI